MEKQLNRDVIKFEYSICAVVFGADSSILNLPLKDGFSFVKRSLIPVKDHLDSIYDTTDIGLRRAYETARIDQERLDVICIEKHIQLFLERRISREWYDARVTEDIMLLDNQIRAIRLFCECALRCKNVSFKMKSENIDLVTMEYNSLVTISESVGTREISKFHCEMECIPQLSQKINQFTFPIKNNILNVAHRYYDLSYHQENYISITLLIVALEMIFLSEENSKKEKLSKRCAVFMHDRKEDRITCYTKMLVAYKQRSNFVHDGLFLGIEDETILFLRNCVRSALISIDVNTFDKKAFIHKMKEKVKATDYLRTDYNNPM